MPYALKGIDATLFMVFQALGVTVTVRPVLGDEAWEGWNERRQEIWYEEQEDKNVDDGDFEAQDESISRVGTKFHGLEMSDGMIEGCGDPSDVSSSRPLNMKCFAKVDRPFNRNGRSRSLKMLFG